MKAPQVVFLEGKKPLARLVAEVLLQGRTTLPLDLGDTQVWVPTAGAGRRIRESLAVLAAERQTGVLSPAFLQPMQALLGNVENLATRTEREAAWLSALKAAPADEWANLLPDPSVIETPAGGLGVAGMFCDLCDLLAEGGLNPEHPSLPKLCAEDASRWQQMQPLHSAYRSILTDADRLDPNETRLAALARPEPTGGLRRVVVACIPDLADAPVRYLEGLAKRGVSVVILVWKPADLPGGFDHAGRPRPEEWSSCPIDLAPGQIKVSRQAEEETLGVLDFLAAANPPGDYALALADETLGVGLAGEIMRRGATAFLPEGRILAGEEPAKIALEWGNWQSGGDLRVLRNLLQWPHFQHWLGSEARLFPAQMLVACDYLITDPLCETLDEAQEFLAHTSLLPETPPPPAAVRLIAALGKKRRIHFTEILENAWPATAEGAETARRVLELWQEIDRSPLLHDWPEGRIPAFSRALRSERVFDIAPSGSVELSGWLETLWIEADRIAICGCVEGRLPASVNEHPFLPDSTRAALGLQDNARRLARDAYLMSCLLSRQQPENLQFSFSRFDSEGSPTLPSRLLLRTRPEHLPDRVRQLFAPVAGNRTQPNRENGWRWSLPLALRRTEFSQISPSKCKEYLACPLRYYWKNVLRLDAYDADPREMDARRFGSLLHRAVELFAIRAPDEAKASLIEKLVLEEFAAEAARMFGPRPTATVRVQLESAQVRLRAFAKVQAAEYAAGWRILDVEKRIAPEMENPLKVGRLNLSAQVDRIETHPDLGLRILDYKTFSTAKPPEKTHFGPARSDHFLPESQVSYQGKEKSWTELQLPLYRSIASQIYDTTNIQTAYFLLTADPSETRVAPFGLDDESYASALDCADAIAQRIEHGIFWPPQQPPGNWEDPFRGLFLNGAPEDCLAPDTIEFLQGKR